MKQFIITGILLFFVNLALYASPPTWWTDEVTEIIDTEADEENYSPANLGQLKHVAKQAKAHLDDHLPGGSGGAITSLVESFEPRAGQGYTQQQIDDFIEANYSPVNLGQLKAVAKPFYDRLLEIEYDTKQNLINRGYPSSWAFDYPWNPSTPVEENYAPSNLGQLKIVFSFDISGMVFNSLIDIDEDGVPDQWEDETLGDLTGGANDDPDGDGRSNLTEYLAGSDPTTADAEIGTQFVATGLQVYTPLE